MRSHDLIKAALFTPGENGHWGLPILLWGMPGTVKTASILSVCVEYGLPCELLAPGERGEGAFGVVPVPDKNWVLRYPRPDWADWTASEGRGVVFVDEVTTAPPAVKPGIMGLTLGRRIGSHALPRGVRVIGAANPPDLCGGYDLSAAEANRFGHIQWAGASVDEHLDHMANDDGLGGIGDNAAPDAWQRAVAEEERVLAEWPAAWAKARGAEAGFLRAKPELKNNMPAADSPDLQRAWPSDRTWKMAVRALASAEIHKLDVATRDTFVASFIGEGAAAELFSYLAHADIPDPTEWLAGKVKFAHDPMRIDRTVAAVTAASLIAVQSDEKALAFIAILGKMITDKVPQDLLIPALAHTTDKNAAARASLMKQNRPLLAEIGTFVALRRKYKDINPAAQQRQL